MNNLTINTNDFAEEPPFTPPPNQDEVQVLQPPDNTSAVQAPGYELKVINL
jgi:hypothetical protein